MIYLVSAPRRNPESNFLFVSIATIDHHSHGARYLLLRLPLQSCRRNRGAEEMMRILRQFLTDESGVTAIEYGLIASLISLTIIAAVNRLGGKLSGTFNEIASNLH